MSEQTFNHFYPETRAILRFDAPFKRAFDVVVALVALILLAPVFALIAIAIKRDSPGPVIYRGPRVGKDGKVFQILKFRTMYETPTSHAGPRVTAADDPRITRLGRWLRSTKLNELPQFWNVLRGDMSVVGPRPEDPTIARDWPAHVRERILTVRPGITSPTSVLYHNEEELLRSSNVFEQYVQEIGPDKMRLDLLYVRYRSFAGDVDTMLWTVLLLLPALRAQEPPESLLLVGPVTRFVRRYLNWFVIDAMITLAAVGVAGGVWRIYGPLNVGWLKSIGAALALALLFSLTAAVVGVNRIMWRKSRPEDVFDILIAWLIAVTLASVANLVARILPLGLVALASVLALGGFVGIRYRSRLLTGLLSAIMRRRKRCVGRERVLIVGADREASFAATLLRQWRNSDQYELVGLVDEDPFAQGMRVYGVDVIGTWSDVPSLVCKHDIGLVILADPSITQKDMNELARVCCETNRRVVRMPDLAGVLGQWWIQQLD